MPCFKPISGFKGPNGEFLPVARKGADGQLSVPCGRCIGCRVARSRMWALRCVHEASLHAANSFVTLTYRDADLPPGGSLCYRDFQLFMKRLRKFYAGRTIRYFVCGEYGEQLLRPHYHACLFGVDFSEDRRPVSLLGAASRRRYTSALLERLWAKGSVDITDVNYRTAGYAARYILKKVVGDEAESHYSRVDGDGVVSSIDPEFARMSVRPGLGAEWFGRFESDVLPVDYLVHEGRKFPVPPYYDRLYKRKRGQSELSEVKAGREFRAYEKRADNTPERLAVKEEVQTARVAFQHQRSYENDACRMRRA